MARPDSISDLIRQDTDRLQQVSETPALDCRLLLEHALSRPSAWLIAHASEPVEGETLAGYQQLLERRLRGEPIAYITEGKGFWQREFKVSRDTLIPRPETELIVETLLERIGEQPQKVLDLGTGTGAIAISLAAERSAWQVTAADISAPAIEICRRNAAGLNNLCLLHSNWFESVSGQFDIIISNPPYLRDNDPHLADLSFEPRLALTAGEDGLDSLRQIIAEAQEYLTPNGMLMLEHGFDQQSQVVKLCESAGFQQIETFRDLQAQPRAVLATRLSVREQS